VSLQPSPIADVPELTARVARATFPKGNAYLTLRDELGTLSRSPGRVFRERRQLASGDSFATSSPSRKGSPGWSPA
jgi:transposase